MPDISINIPEEYKMQRLKDALAKVKEEESQYTIHNGLIKDINGNLHHIDNIPEGTEFNTLIISGLNSEKLPDFSKIKINDCLEINDCPSLKAIKNLPQNINLIVCNCPFLDTIDVSSNVNHLFVMCCNNLKYISDNIQDNVLYPSDDFANSRMAQCKRNWQELQKTGEQAKEEPNKSKAPIPAILKQGLGR